MTLFDLNDQKDDIFDKSGRQIDQLLKKDKGSLYKSIFDSTTSVVIDENINKQQEQQNSKTNIVTLDGGKTEIKINSQGNLQGVVELLQKTAASHTGSLQESLTETLGALKKLVNSNKKLTSESVNTESPPLSVVIPSSASQNNQPKLDSTNIDMTVSDDIVENNSENNNEDSSQLHIEESSIEDNNSNTESETYVNNETETSDTNNEFHYEADISPTRLFMCPAKPYHSRFSVMGEMFIQK